MKKKTIQKRKISKECWSLDYAFVKWLNEHLKVYKKDASKMVNLEYHRFDYNGEELTQLEIINRLINLTDTLMLDYDMWNDDCIQKSKEMLELWAVVFPAMWW